MLSPNLMKFCGILALVAHGVHLRRGDPVDPLGPPPPLGEDPTKLMCTVGKRPPAAWCKDWVTCIQSQAAPENDATAVRKAWGPAQCEEYCGIYPMTAKPEGSLLAENTRRLQAMFVHNTTHKDCMNSCKNFQSSLSECLATIIFDSGAIAVMKENQPSKYNSFVGGCMAQLQAYHTATKPMNGASILPGASGCTVHGNNTNIF
eukprot:GEMP01079998.1.p1 GENE.GEMP01079998.1~~GEMP01079998.1.p1  ORF type:complete len:204 (+),score=40.16 GEMP01079998.1:176-787(+)